MTIDFHPTNGVQFTAEFHDGELSYFQKGRDFNLWDFAAWVIESDFAPHRVEEEIQERMKAMAVRLVADAEQEALDARADAERSHRLEAA